MNIVVLAGELRDTSIPAYHYKSLLIDWTFAGPQATTHLRKEIADADGSAASCTEGRKNGRYACRPGQVFIDERSYINCPRGGKLLMSRIEQYRIRRSAGD